MQREQATEPTVASSQNPTFVNPKSSRTPTSKIGARNARNVNGGGLAEPAQRVLKYG